MTFAEYGNKNISKSVLMRFTIEQHSYPKMTCCVSNTVFRGARGERRWGRDRQTGEGSCGEDAASQQL